MSISMKTSLKIQDLCNARKIAASLTDEHKKVLVGYFHGFANGVVKRTAPDGSRTYEGLSGNFEAVPTDPEADVKQSAVAYLGDSFQPMISNILKAQANEKGSITGVAFAFGVSLEKATNPAGYTWILEPLQEPVGLDPLAQTRLLLTKPREKVLPLPAKHGKRDA